MSRLRVVTWNVHGLRAGAEPVARAVRTLAPDVLLVQESGPRRSLGALGADLGMAVATDPIVFPRRRVRNAVLVQPPLQIRSHRLLRFDGGTWLSPRGAMIARVDGLTAVSLHLGLRREERLQHVRQLLEALDGAGGPVVIGGDLNAHPDDPATQALAERYPEVWSKLGEGEGLTMPAVRPTARIDYLFAAPAVLALRALTAGDAAVSDHLMVVADLELDP